jgi:tetratricopeptide (TPR) repeat protein
MRPAHKRRINLIAAVIVLAVVAGGSAAIHLLHDQQVARNISALLREARRAEEAGEAAKAMEALEQYLAVRSDDATTWAWYARTVDANSPQDVRGRTRAYLAHARAVQLDPTNAEARRSCIELALLLGRTEDARRHLDVLFAAAPKDDLGRPADAWVEKRLGDCARAEGRPGGSAEPEIPGAHDPDLKERGAETWYRLAIAHDPTAIDAYQALVRLLSGPLKRPAEGRDVANAMVQSNPSSAGAYVARWRLSREADGKADPEDVTRAVGLDPDSPDVLEVVSLAALDRGDRGAARASLQRGQKLHPKDPRFPMLRAQLEILDGRVAEAIVHLRAAVAAFPDNSTFALTLTETLIAEGQIEGKQGARELIQTLSGKGLAEGYVRYLEGRLRMREGRWAEAIDRLDLARTLLAGDASMQSGLGRLLAVCYDRLGDDHTALATLRRAAEVGSDPRARLALAAAAESQGRLDEALRAHVALLSERPGSRLDLARLTLKLELRKPPAQRRWNDVERWLSEADRVSPDDPQVAALRGAFLETQGRGDAARRVLEDALRRDPGSATLAIAHAQLVERLQGASEALAALDRAEATSPALQAALLPLRITLTSRTRAPDVAEAIERFSSQLANRPAGEQPALLEALLGAWLRLGDLPRARQTARAIVALQPDNLRAWLDVIDLAAAARDADEFRGAVAEVRRIEGEQGTLWRYAEAAWQVLRARQGDPEGLPLARQRLAEITERRRDDWWGAPALRAQLAEIEGDAERSLDDYLKAFRLGFKGAETARRVVGLLYQASRHDDLDRLVLDLREQGMLESDLTIVAAANALRRGETARGVDLARQAVPEASRDPNEHLLLGRLLQVAGREDEAEKAFRRAVELGPSLPGTWLTLVEHLARAGRRNEARAALGEAAKALPPEQGRIPLALGHLLVGEPQQAQQLVESALAARPDDSATLRAAAAFYLRQAQPDRATPLLGRLLDPASDASESDRLWARRARDGILLREGDPEKIHAVLAGIEDDIRKDPKNLDHQRLRATLLAMDVSRRAEAVQALERLREAKLLGPDEQFLLALLYAAEDRWDLCRARLVVLIEQSQKDPRHLAAYIDLLIRERQLDEAERRLAELQAMAPDPPIDLPYECRLLVLRDRRADVPARLKTRAQQRPQHLGHIASLLDDYGFNAEAEAVYRAAVAQRPDEPERGVTLAAFLARHDRVGEAMPMLMAAQRTCPIGQIAAAALPIFEAPSATEVQRQQAEAWVTEAIARDSAAFDLMTKLAIVRIQQGRFDESEALNRRVLAGAPQSIEALNNLAWTLALREPNQAAEALVLIDRAFALAGENRTLRDTRAVAAIRAGRSAEAVRELEAMRQSAPDLPVTALHLAWAYHAAGQLDEARKAWEDARRLGLKVETLDPLERPHAQQLERSLSSTSVRR